MVGRWPHETSLTNGLITKGVFANLAVSRWGTKLQGLVSGQSSWDLLAPESAGVTLVCGNDSHSLGGGVEKKGPGSQVPYHTHFFTHNKGDQLCGLAESLARTVARDLVSRALGCTRDWLLCPFAAL